MAVELPTRQRLSESAKQERLRQMQLDVAMGRLTVRQMTPAERRQADRDRERAISRRAERAARRSG